MSTLDGLDRQALLYRWDVELGPRQQLERVIYVSPYLATNWLPTVLPTLGSTWNIEQDPLQQVDARVAQFVAGETITFSRHFRPLTPHSNGVWELKTADVRMFGWFPAFDTLLLVNANLAEPIKRLRLYRPMIEEVIRFRDHLPLDHPKFIPGDDARAVVSNFDLP